MSSNKIKVCLFIRVSTDKQDCDRQLFELTENCEQRNYEVTKTISTTISGGKDASKRPDLKELFAAADKKEFSKVLVTEISRLGRKSKDIRATIDYLHQRGISIIFKNLGCLESLDEQGNETFVTNIIISIYSELAQEERRILVERTKSGLQKAIKKGKILGRKVGSGMNDKTILKKYSKLSIHIREGLSLTECMKLHDVSKNTVLKVKRILK
jgi:DNA invertase Pin-like site-specific DNA recombinase